jgi:hypothetical protein
MKKRIIKKRQTIKQKEEGNKQTYYQKWMNEHSRGKNSNGNTNTQIVKNEIKTHKQSFKIREMDKMDEMPICEMIKCSLANTLCVIPMLFKPLVWK